MNVFAKFDEIPLMILEVIKETKRYGHTFIWSDVQTNNVKTVYPPANWRGGGGGGGGCYSANKTFLQTLKGS